MWLSKKYNKNNIVWYEKGFYYVLVSIVIITTPNVLLLATRFRYLNHDSFPLLF